MALVILLFLHKSIKNKRVWAFLIAALIGTTCFGAHAYFVNNEVVKFDGQSGTVIGTLSDKKIVEGSSYQYYIKIKDIDGNQFFLPTYLTIYSKTLIDCDYGDTIKFDAQSIQSEKEDNTMFDNLVSKSRYLYTNVNDATEFSVEKSFTLSGMFLKFRDTLIDRIIDGMQYPQGQVVSGILFGKKDLIPFKIVHNFNKAGISHILAFSGLHVNMLSMILLTVLIQLKCPKKIASIILIIALIAFAGMAGFTISAVRACLMSAIVTLGALFKTRVKSLDALIFAAGFILFFSPQVAVGLSFLLSFGSSLGIILFHRKLLMRFQAMAKFNGFLTTIIWNSLSLSMCAALFTLPILMLAFKRISLIFFLTNLVIMPFIPIIFVLAILQLLLGSFWVGGAEFMGTLNSYLVGGICFVVEGIGNIFGYLKAYQSFVPLAIIGAIIVIGIGIYFYRDRVRARVLILASVLIFLAPYALNYSLYINATSIDFIGTGYTSSVVIRNRSKTIVLNCGHYRSYERLIDYFDTHGIDKIDVLVLTSSKSSDIKGTDSLIENFKTKLFIYPEQLKDSGTIELANYMDIPNFYIEDADIFMPSLNIKYLNYADNLCLKINMPNCAVLYSDNLNSLYAASKENAINVAIYDGKKTDEQVVSDLNVGYFISYTDELDEQSPNKGLITSWENYYFTVNNGRIGKGDF